MMQHYYVLYTYMVNTNQRFLNTLRQSVQKVLLAHEAKLQPLAEMPEKLQPAAVLAPRAKLEEAAATVLAEKLRQQHWARANAQRHHVDQ